MISAFYYRKVHLKGLQRLSFGLQLLGFVFEGGFCRSVKPGSDLSAGICAGCSFLYRAQSVQPGIFQVVGEIV